MKLIYVMLICTLLGSSCEEDGPYGFYQEPQIEFTGSRDSFVIRYANSEGKSDSVFIKNTIPRAVCPVGLNDTFMSYEVIANDSSFGLIELKYSISVLDNNSRYALNLVFDSSTFSADKRLKLFRDETMTDSVVRFYNDYGGWTGIFISF